MIPVAVAVDGPEPAITASVESRLDQAVAAGRITKAQEQRRLERLGQILTNIVNRTPPAGGPGGYGGPASDGASPGDPGPDPGPPPAA